MIPVAQSLSLVSLCSVLAICCGSGTLTVLSESGPVAGVLGFVQNVG